MKREFTHHIELNDTEYTYTARATFAYDGIGEYEAWGYKLFDKGKLRLSECEVLSVSAHGKEVTLGADELRTIEAHAEARAAFEEGKEC